MLVAGAFGMVALKLLGNALVAQGQPLLQSLAIGSVFVLTVVLDIVLIPPLGGLGAATASTIAYSAAGIVMGAAFVRALDVRPGELVPRLGDARALLQRVRGLLRRRPRHEPELPA
jgi:Na+-driven multidrug efflux pump